VLDSFIGNISHHLLLDGFIWNCLACHLLDLGLDGEQVWATRPFTLLHGDVNPGNLWRRKDSKDGGEALIFGDWQVLMKCPIAWDFITIFLCTKDTDTVALLKDYHAELLKVGRRKATRRNATLFLASSFSIALFWCLEKR
jgi:thiamine kinase-like enzyme